MIRVPDWIDSPLGHYYLYFADHKGSYIRLAYADHPTGPWAIDAPGSLRLAQSRFLIEPPIASRDQVARFEARLEQRGALISHDTLSEITTPHIASPDVHVDPVSRRIVMYFHGLEDVGTQVSRVATSRNGVDFEAKPEILGPPYMRVFPNDGMIYALTMPGRFYRSKRRPARVRAGPGAVQSEHAAFSRTKRGNELFVFWTQVGEAPERTAEPHRPHRRLARLEGKPAHSGAPARAFVGRFRRGADPIGAQHCLWAGLPAPRSGNLRGRRAELSPLRSGRRKRHRDRRNMAG